MLKRLLFASAIITGSAIAWAPDAMAFEVCGKRDAIVGTLKADLGEVRVDGAAAGPSAFYEFFASDRTRTWTVLLSGVNGISCVMAVGEHWNRPMQVVVPTHDGWPRPGGLLVR
ncbi:MAG TPA: hypothetical protein VMY41_14575 [Thermohalobaculum sp.]|nr:hypothetical protein [Thermohalobaculum sp.]